jgi:hypothetical protein
MKRGSARQGRLWLREPFPPAKRIRGKYPLKDLVARMPGNCIPAEEDWGKPLGREVW